MAGVAAVGEPPPPHAATRQIRGSRTRTPERSPTVTTTLVAARLRILRAPEDQDLSDAMNGSAVHAFGESVAERAAVVPVIHGNAHLDQAVRGERAVHFGNEFRCDSRVPDPHGRSQRMREGLEAGALM